uniref:Uncharacterized protein n=1 Tax=Zooxanthella nutricula TaxID=1333877 RepID=A0A7S2JWP3_9DINO
MPGRVQRTVAAALVVAAPALEVAPPKDDKSDITKLYNSNVKSMQPMKRPLSIPDSKGGKKTSGALYPTGARHEGMHVETTSGDKYLVHKVPGQGTVVTDARHMGKSWEEFGNSEDLSGKDLTISDLVKAGGKNFNTVTSNCQHAVKDMKRQVDPTYRSHFETFMDDLGGTDRVEHHRGGGFSDNVRFSSGRGSIGVSIQCSIL